jgi:hypothetical protein
METIKKEKNFDAVRMMRDIRDKVSTETQNMSFSELKAYIENKLRESKFRPIGK